MRRLVLFLVLFLVTTVAFGVDKTYKAPSGNLILDANNNIKLNKNTGIGIDPSYKLHVSGAGQTGFFQYPGSTNGELVLATTAAASSVNLRFADTNSDTSTVIRGNSSGFGNLEFYTGATASSWGTLRMNITSAGKIGMGGSGSVSGTNNVQIANGGNGLPGASGANVGLRIDGLPSTGQGLSFGVSSAQGGWIQAMNAADTEQYNLFLNPEGGGVNINGGGFSQAHSKIQIRNSYFNDRFNLLCTTSVSTKALFNLQCPNSAAYCAATIQVNYAGVDVGSGPVSGGVTYTCVYNASGNWSCTNYGGFGTYTTRISTSTSSGSMNINMIGHGGLNTYYSVTTETKFNCIAGDYSSSDCGAYTKQITTP